jgi:hypothetical protein
MTLTLDSYFADQPDHRGVSTVLPDLDAGASPALAELAEDIDHTSLMPDSPEGWARHLRLHWQSTPEISAQKLGAVTRVSHFGFPNGRSSAQVIEDLP